MPVTTDDAVRRTELMRACPRILSGARPLTMGERLTRVQAYDVRVDELPDVYGEGGAVRQLEEQVAELLGTDAALLFPTGTMAQQVALRCWADRTGSPLVAMHPDAHLRLHEADAVSVLSGLRPVQLGARPVPPGADDIRDHPEPFGTVLLELPWREYGFYVPSWGALTDAVAAARERDAVVHLDGARLWDAAVAYGRPLPEITGLFDSVYVSFYKALGAASGAALAGPADLIEQARVWRHRYGGRAFQQWPVALGALVALADTLPLLPSWVAHANPVSQALASVPGAVVFPNPPHTHQFQLWLPFDAGVLMQACREFAEAEGVWTFGTWQQRGAPGTAMTEVTVADPALEWTPDDVHDTVVRLLSRLG